MLKITLIIAGILLLLNFIPTRLFTSANRFNYIQTILFGTLFIGIWFYKIQSDISLQKQKKMDLQEKVYRSTNRSRFREFNRYHEPWDYVAKNEKEIQSKEEEQINFSVYLLRILTIDSIIVLLFNYYGFKKVKSAFNYYRKNVIIYSIFAAFCTLVEVFNFYMFH